MLMPQAAYSVPTDEGIPMACTRSDALNGGSSYPTITVMVNVASNASTPQVNQVSVSGGGSSNASANDSTIIATGTCNTGVYYYFDDQIGSARVITDSSGNVCYDADFYPYGGERVVTDAAPQDYKFAGKERDAESGLDDFEARYFSSQFGRFMSPDPMNAGADPSNPQSWNGYSYVINNPLTLTDPSGMFYNPGVGDDGGGCDPFFGCTDILFSLGIGNENDRQSPIYTPPDTQNTTEPNPRAGDPDPSDPFSGPVWQEGGPQIPTQNLAELLGVPDPPILVFDATGSEGATPQSPTFKQQYNQCMQGAGTPVKVADDLGAWGLGSLGVTLASSAFTSTMQWIHGTSATNIASTVAQQAPNTAADAGTLANMGEHELFLEGTWATVGKSVYG